MDGEVPVKILIVKLSAIGDVTHTLPALNRLREHFPHAHIAWLVEEAAADIVRGHPALDRVLVCPRKSWLRGLRRGRLLSSAGGVLRFLRELRDIRYDLVIDFQGLLKSGIWVLMSRAGRKAGWGRGGEHAEMSYLFLTERVPGVDMDLHAVDRSLALLERLGIPRAPAVFDFPIGDENERESAELLREGGVGDGDTIACVNPMARWPTKLWVPERFAEVASRLVDRGMRVVFTGSGGDRKAVDEICARAPGSVLRLDGKTSLKTLAAVYRRARVLVTTDTGPMHIAAAVGTPVVALFGPTAPWRTGPYGEGHTVLRVDLECSACRKRICQTTRYEECACMRRISSDQVVHAVLEKVRDPAAEKRRDA